MEVSGGQILCLCTMALLHPLLAESHNFREVLQYRPYRNRILSLPMILQGRSKLYERRLNLDNQAESAKKFQKDEIEKNDDVLNLDREYYDQQRDDNSQESETQDVSAKNNWGDSEENEIHENKRKSFAVGKDISINITCSLCLLDQENRSCKKIVNEHRYNCQLHRVTVPVDNIDITLDVCFATLRVLTNSSNSNPSHCLREDDKTSST